MNKVLSLFFIAVFFNSISVEAQISKSTLDKKIIIPEDVFIGEIRHLDIYENKILITDIMLGQVILFDGDNWQILDPEACHPGFKFMPIQAQFGNDGEIFITNSGVWGFRFESDGQCIGAVKEKTIQPEKFSFTDRIYGIRSLKVKKEIVSWNKDGNDEKVEFSIKPTLPNAEYRFEGGGIIEVDDNIYVITALDPMIYKYNRRKGVVKSTEFKSQYFSQIKNDITDDIEDPKFFKEIGTVIKTNSVILNLFRLNSDTGVVVFSQNQHQERRYYGVTFNLSDLSIVNTLTFDVEPKLIKNETMIFIERTSEGYENETIELIFKTL
jgi:hypothetical protein